MTCTVTCKLKYDHRLPQLLIHEMLYRYIYVWGWTYNKADMSFFRHDLYYSLENSQSLYLVLFVKKNPPLYFSESASRMLEWLLSALINANTASSELFFSVIISCIIPIKHTQLLRKKLRGTEQTLWRSGAAQHSFFQSCTIWWQWKLPGCQSHWGNWPRAKEHGGHRIMEAAELPASSGGCFSPEMRLVRSS